MDLSQIETIVAIFVGFGTLISMSAMSIRWMVKHYLEEIKHELKPNGGGSIKDQVNRLETRQDKSDILRKETYHKVEKLETKICYLKCIVLLFSCLV